MSTPDPDRMKAFFARSDLVDHMVLRPLSHVRPNWELTWEDDAYAEEEGSLADLLNEIIDELAVTQPPARYHDHEDRLAEFVIAHLKWQIRKVKGRWVGADYGIILEQGAYHDVGRKELLAAAAGRIWAAIKRNQLHFDGMEKSHRHMLAAALSVILFHGEMYEEPYRGPQDR